MGLINKIKPAVLERFVHKFFEPATTICAGTGNFTFPPSKELISDLNSGYTITHVKPFENGSSFSAYSVDYQIALDKGEAICKAASFTCPDVTMYGTWEKSHVFLASE